VNRLGLLFRRNPALLSDNSHQKADQVNDTTQLATPRQKSETGPVAPFGVTRDYLLRNYESILRANAIFYPVAYQFQHELGRGQQGVVMLGLRQGARGCITEHAIKVFTPALYETPKQYWTDMGRIATQITRLHTLQNPNIVYRHSYEETQGIGYIEMQAIDGIDLRRLLRGQHLAVARERSTDDEWKHFTKTIFRVQGDRLTLQPGIVVYIIRSILRGLEALHEANFLHSDIKPANVMIDRLGYVKIIDFGRAVIPDEQQGILFGSPLYMAPEIHRRDAGRRQSDLYSVGLVALEMLRGETLIGAFDATESELLKAKESLPDRLEELLPDYVLANSELVEILQRLVSVSPDDRYANAREAEVGDDGLKVIDRQLVQAGLDSEYVRDLSDYMSKLIDPTTNRVRV